MLVSDLDGTLLRDGRRIGREEQEMLNRLGNRGILRVIATGRSLHSACRVLEPATPIDYLIVSSGAGIIRWPEGKLIVKHTMEPRQVESTFRELARLGLDFMLHDPIPDNHRFTFFTGGGENPDFQRRVLHYRPFAREGDIDSFPPSREGAQPEANRLEACQFVAIHPEDHDDRYFRILRGRLSDLTVIRTTSPMDGRSVWLEVFPPAVSKSQSAEFLRMLHGIAHGDTLALGNDYNDEDMLAWAAGAYVVDSAPAHLRDLYGLHLRGVKGEPGDAIPGLAGAVEEWFSG
jgi:hydroxymethylpyrimidine pyrophosphatase-like HAD family hydrolase